MAKPDGVMVYAGSYNDVEDAKADFEGIRLFHNEKFIGEFEAAVFEKEPGGKVKVVDTVTTMRSFGAKAGALTGALVGIFFPPALLAEVAVGAGAGALMGNLFSGLKRGDIKEMGDMLDEGQAGAHSDRLHYARGRHGPSDEEGGQDPEEGGRRDRRRPQEGHRRRGGRLVARTIEVRLRGSRSPGPDVGALFLGLSGAGWTRHPVVSDDSGVGTGKAAVFEPVAVIRFALIALAGWVSVVWACSAVYVSVSYVAATRYIPKRPILAASAGHPARVVDRRLDPAAAPVVPGLRAQDGQRWRDRAGGARARLLPEPGRLPVPGEPAARGGIGPALRLQLLLAAGTRALLGQRARLRGAGVRRDRCPRGRPGHALDRRPARARHDLRAAGLVRRAVLIALPARGVAVARPGPWQVRLAASGRVALPRRPPDTIVGTPVLSIYSAHDNLVHPVQTSRLDGPSATNVEVSGPGHLSVLFDRRVGDAVCDFLLGRRH